MPTEQNRTKQNKTSLRLISKIPQIMNLWEQRANEEIKSAHSQEIIALRGTLPEYLLQMADALSTTIDRSRARKIYDKNASTRVGKGHGKKRATILDYTMDQLIFEYHILRQVICDVMEEEAILTPVEREVIVCSIEQAVNDAATGFGDTDVASQVEITKQMEETAKKLATERRKIEALIAESPVGIALLHGPKFIFEKVNTKFTGLVSKREYIGKTYEEAYPELIGSFPHENLKLVFKTGDSFVGHEVKIRVEISPGVLDDRYFDFGYIRVLDSEGKPYGIFCHSEDVTERVIIRQQLEESIKNLGEERELRESFVTALTHDLRTPITAAKMIAQLLARNIKDPSQLLKIAGIVQNMNRGDQMIQDLLDVSRIKIKEKLPLNIVECDLNGIVHSTIDELTSIYGDRFIFKNEDEIAGYWDCRSIHRMIENLVSNAIKYGSPLTPVTVSLEKKLNWIEISIHNHGNPIPVNEQQILFEKFHRASSATSSSQKGWGIGLTLVRGLAEAHGGSVQITSELSRGTTFTIIIPQDSRNIFNDESKSVLGLAPGRSDEVSNRHH